MEDVEALPESAEKKDLEKLVRSVEDSVQYIDWIVADFHDYVKPIQPVLETVDLKSLLEETLNGISIPDNIKITLKVVTGFNV